MRTLAKPEGPARGGVHGLSSVVLTKPPTPGSVALAMAQSSRLPPVPLPTRPAKIPLKKLVGQSPPASRARARAMRKEGREGRIEPPNDVGQGLVNPVDPVHYFLEA